MKATAKAVRKAPRKGKKWLADGRSMSTVVRQAICVIQKVGWTKHALAIEGDELDQDGNYKVGAVCAVGGINAAILKSQDTAKINRLAYKKATAIIKAAQIPDDEGSGNYKDSEYLVDHNDAQFSRTPVLRRLARLARRLESRGL